MCDQCGFVVTVIDPWSGAWRSIDSGPKQAMLALGYAGWSAGQLESEIQWNGWLHCPADPELVFDPDLDRKYDRALKKLGIDIGLLSTEAGHG